MPDLVERRRLQLAAVIVVGTLSAAAYLVMHIFFATGCTGTGRAYYGCAAFECVHGDTLTMIELLAIGPALGVLMALSRRWTRRIHVTVWILALGWLGAGRFVLYVSLAGRIVKHCTVS